MVDASVTTVGHGLDIVAADHFGQRVPHRVGPNEVGQVVLHHGEPVALERCLAGKGAVRLRDVEALPVLPKTKTCQRQKTRES